MAVTVDVYDQSSNPNYNPNLNLIGPLYINEITSTSVTVDVDIAGLAETPTLYYLTYQKLLNDGITPDGSPTTISSITKPIVVSGLTAGAYYNFNVSAWKGTQLGNSSLYKGYKLSSPSQSGSMDAIPLDPKKVTPGKSFYVLSSKPDKKYVVSSRSFSSLALPSSTSKSYVGPDGVSDTIINYAESYYTFGTSLILSPSDTAKFPGAALGFFVGTNGTSGYFIFLEPAGAAFNNSRKSVRIAKVDGKNIIVLADSQKTDQSTLDAVYATQSYVIDVKVKIANSTVTNNSVITIEAYINGFKITATDTAGFVTGKGLQKIIGPTNKIALVAYNGGSVYYDYVYANKIDKERYFSASYNSNIYQGQFSNDILSTSFGDLVYDGKYAADEITQRGVALDEFGTTVREILKVNTKFESRPAYPIKWSTGDNRFATILGSKISNFGGEAYVLNNTSTTIPLQDGDVASFYIYGNSIGPSGQLEYITDDTSQYAVKEPATFDSTWLQSESDVKALATWIKDKVVNRGKTISLEIFGNPLLSVGDIITIKYTFNGLNGTEKFIITNVSHSYDQGLSTSIVCRIL